MNRIQLLPLGKFPGETLIDLSAGLRKRFGVSCEILPAQPEPAFAFNFARQQYSSTEILASLMKSGTPSSERILAVTAVDLYIPILTFVFGEAQLHGSCAVVSFHRLRQEFYGLPANSTVLRDRLLKEAVHELGHTMPLGALRRLPVRDGAFSWSRVDRFENQPVLHFVSDGCKQSIGQQLAH